MIGRLINEVTSNKKSSKIINGTVILMKKTAFGSLLDVNASTIDSVFELLGNAVTLQLVSADNADPANGNGGKLGKLEELENWNLTFTPPLTGQDSLFKVSFEWDEALGTPGAIILRNNHASEFFLKTITLDDVPGAGQIHFLCNSWVYPDKHYKKPRVFFSNKTYLPHETPAPLRKYREEELIELRGDGKAELKEGDRVYDYAVYNDLGDPDKDAALARPVLGGSAEFPYPRRGRTSRPPSRSDPNTESRRFLPASLFNVYVPRDEQFGHLKMSDFIAFNLKGVVNNILPLFQDFVDLSINEFDSFEEVDNLYFNGIRFPTALGSILSKIPLPMMNEIFRTDGGQLFKFPVPQVIQDRSKPTAWRTDEEFGREMLAGVNPLLIRLLKEFPPTSKLDPEVYGDQTSSITKEDIEYNLEGISVEEALASNRLFMLDHHDPVIPYLRRINSDTGTKAHASRTILFLRGDSTLKPVAIELSTPHSDGDKFGVVSKVYTPAEHGIEGSIWQFAKAFVAVNDCGYHQLISHWLNTHAVLEPFIIATNRQLSVVHPVYKLLHPHYRDTMTINALAREVLVNADGIMETTFFQAKYCLEFSSHIYKSWNFLEQALPTDLKKRGVAVDDGDSPHGLRLLIKDYPYAVDGLNIWFALEKWVRDYCSFYYKSNEMVQEDPELQAWWKELREVGHGDKKDEPRWPKMQTLEELIESCTTIIWIASALHAAVNFGQYAYEGYSPNRPTLSRRLMPEKDTPEYAEVEKNPEKAFFRTMTSQLQCLTGMTVVEVLSKHPSDEVYLGQRDDNWTTDATPLAAFQAFNNRLREIEEEIINLNMDKKLKNRAGPVNVPYTLLFPSGEVGLSGKGIPNSISI